MPVQLGIDVLLGEVPAVLRGKRVGLITNPTGVDGRLRPTVELLRACADFRLVEIGRAHV